MEREREQERKRERYPVSRSLQQGFLCTVPKVDAHTHFISPRRSQRDGPGSFSPRQFKGPKAPRRRECLLFHGAHGGIPRTGSSALREDQGRTVQGQHRPPSHPGRAPPGASESGSGAAPTCAAAWNAPGRATSA
jgi:hypothetical protein